MKKLKKDAAFSLIELIVVIALATVLAGGAVTGVNQVRRGLKTLQGASVIRETVEHLRWETLNGFYVQTRLEFLPTYLVAVSEPAEVTFVLERQAPPQAPCGPGEEGLFWEDDARLLLHEVGGTKRTRQSSRPVIAGGHECVAVATSPFTQWEYQLTDDEGHLSNAVRFFHFDSDRQNPEGLFLEENNYALLMEADKPYSRFLNSDSPINPPLSLLMHHPQGDTETVEITP